jgi:multidrug efflux pump subunit AcrA (membrane-fusion protein)
MKRALIIIVIIVVAVVVVYFARISSIQRSQREREELINDTASGIVIPVIAAQVTMGDVEKVIRYTGTVEPEEEVDVYPKISGRIMSMKVDEGDVVTKDDVLAVIDPEITGQRFEPFAVTAPIRGKIGEVYLDPGAYVTQMQPLVNIVNDRHVKVTIGVLEKDYHIIKEGTPVRLEFDALPGRVINAKVTNRSPVVNSRTGSAPTEIRLDNADGMLKSGMFARVQVITEVHADAVLMPLAATLTEVLPGRGIRAETTVFVVNGDVAAERDVVLGLAGPTHYEVLEGLRPGEQVIISGQNLLRHGAKIRVSASES